MAAPAHIARENGKKGGRPKGSGHLNIRDYLSDKDVKTFMEFLLANYMEDSRLMVWLGDHLFGKAIQPLSNADGQPLMIAFDPNFNATARKAEGDRK